MKVLVTGATGFVGRSLQQALSRAGHAVVAVSRTAGDILWDPSSGPLPAEAMTGVDAVVHLAGENIGKGRWSKEKMERIRESRRVGTRNVVAGIAGATFKPRVLFSASAVGYYGDRGDEILTEESRGGDDFLADVCAAWEQEAAAVEKLGIRRVSGRFGIVLGADDGALPRMLTPFRMFVGGPIGNGRQWMSWIHVQDVCGLILHAIEREAIRGPFNVTSPNPVTNREFAKTIGRVLGRPSFFRMPRFMLRIVVGKFARYLAASQRAAPNKAEAAGYVYRFAELESALRDCLAPLTP